jgi:PEP-CTERM motif
MKKLPSLIFSVVLCAFGASAATITYTAVGTSSGGNMENASATFTTSLNSIHVTLDNFLSNPKTVAQNISDLFFTLSTGQTSGTLTSSSGREVTVASSGSYTLGPTVSTGWTLTSSGGSLLLEVLGTSTAPTHTIIGPSDNGTYVGGSYSNANSSIAGNSSHNPFLKNTVSFDLMVIGVTNLTTVTGATFSFGTAAGNNLAGVATVPEPSSASLLLLAAGSFGGFLLLRRRNRR